MNKKFFLKKTHRDISIYLLSFYAIFLMVSFLFFISFNVFKFTVVLIVMVFSFCMFLCIKVCRSNGLYINDKSLYYKCIGKTYINLDRIVGIKIMPAYTSGKYRNFYQMKNSNGELLYSVALLHTLSSKMYNFEKGDLWFNKAFQKCIICTVTYNKEAMEYLKGIKPNIVFL